MNNGNEGSVFRKADLHVHTPASVCFSDKSVRPEQIVESALAAELEVIGIADHNTVAAIPGVRRAAEGKNLTVFPGVELSTEEGHVLALFDATLPQSALEAFLDRVGIDPGGRGDAITITPGGMETVLKKIADADGVAIAAHIDRFPSGFLEGNGSRTARMRIHASPFLSALEITIPQNKTKWNLGKVRGYPKKYACIQGSDAHSLVEIGRRPVYIRMKKRDLLALKTALAVYETDIRFL